MNMVRNIFESVGLLKNEHDALKVVQKHYGTPFAQKIEKLVRLETGHYRDAVWKQGYQGGMISPEGKTEFPYGWSSLAEFIESTSYKPSQFSRISIAGDSRKWLKFPDSYSFTIYVAWFLWNKRNKDVLSWRSTTDASARKNYESLLNGIKNRTIV